MRKWDGGVGVVRRLLLITILTGSTLAHGFGFATDPEAQFVGGGGFDTPLQFSFFGGGGVGYSQQSLVSQTSGEVARYTGFGWNLGAGTDVSIGPSFGVRGTVYYQGASLPNSANTATQTETASLSGFGAALHLGWSELAVGVGLENLSIDVTSVGTSIASTSNVSATRTAIHASYNFVATRSVGGNIAGKYTLSSEQFSNDWSLHFSLFFILKTR